MKTILTEDKANLPYGYVRIDGNGNVSLTGSLQGTASYALNASYVSTASYAATASYSLNTQIIDTGSFATTGSNTFIGNQSITGSITISGSTTILSPVPDNFPTAGVNDIPGMIAFDEDYIYYCTQKFSTIGIVTHIYDATSPDGLGFTWNQYHSPGASWIQTGPSQESGGVLTPQSGWYFIDDTNTIRQLTNDNVWFGGQGPAPQPNGSGWLCSVNSTDWVYSDSNPTLTFYETNPSQTIWKRTPWNAADTNNSNTFFENQSISASLYVTGSVYFTNLTNESQQWFVTYNSASGQLYYTASSAFGGGTGPGPNIDTSLFVLVSQTSSMSVATASYINPSFIPPATILIQDEGDKLTEAVSSINFVGSGVVATTSGSNVTVTISTSSIDTTSFVTNSQTSSFVTNSQTASFVTNSQTSSFVTNSQTGSFITNSQTSSFVTNSQTSSLSVATSITATTSSYPISVVGTNLYSTSPASGIPSSTQTNNIFLGLLAGRNLSSSLSNAIFIGNQSGGKASGAATDSPDGIICIGSRTGINAVSASYSILLGWYAGSTSAGGAQSIGRNNIIIGTNVTLESSRQDSINIGGLIFGTGSYFSTSTVSSGSSNGKIGINQPLPQYSLDVSGSGNFTNGLTITGSLIITGSETETGPLTINGNTTTTGSVLGNITALSIASNTASLNLSNGNFFTLQLVSGSTTHINPSNISAGQTVNILISTTGSATVTFASSVKQPSGSSYVPTTTTGKDVVTLVSFDSTALYLAYVNNLI